jgi:hypothetical protein
MMVGASHWDASSGTGVASIMLSSGGCGLGSGIGVASIVLSSGGCGLGSGIGVASIVLSSGGCGLGSGIGVASITLPCSIFRASIVVSIIAGSPGDLEKWTPFSHTTNAGRPY